MVTCRVSSLTKGQTIHHFRSYSAKANGSTWVNTEADDSNNTALMPLSHFELVGGETSGSFLRRLQAPHKPGLHNNVILNTDRTSTLKHFELTPNEVRLEFSTAKDPIYRTFAVALCEFEAERRDKETSDGAYVSAGDCTTSLIGLVDRVENHDFCGAGATVVLKRDKLLDVLRKRWNAPLLPKNCINLLN